MEHEHEHDHDQAEHALDLEDYLEIEGFEQYTLTSVGIYIGSSTSQVVVARLTIRRRGSALSTEFAVTDRDVIYSSPPILTPYASGTRMDVVLLESFVREAYAAAALKPEQVDTGVVVITGEALNKENAAEIADLVSGWSGDFICVSAGASHEAVLAAHGSGAVALSEREDCTVLNVDIGGGTTKVSLVQRGRIASLEAFSVGARLVAWGPDGVVTRVEAPARRYAEQLGVSLQVGDAADPDALDQMAELMAEVVLDAIVPGRLAPLRRELMVTPARAPSGDTGQEIDRIVFSGGVSEYVDGRETTSFGDLGLALGRSIRRLLTRAGLDPLVVPAEHGIRATVIGASEFSVQASGQTCYIADERLLPVRNLPVARVEFAPDTDSAQAVSDALARYDRRDLREPLAFAVHFRGPRTYAALRRYAEALVATADGNALHLVLRDDLAQSFGRLIAVELDHRGAVVVVDGISVGDLDYLDIGRPLGATRSIPVTVKSLAFPH
jgi:ethanolamine utilization protein EutA